MTFLYQPPALRVDSLSVAHPIGSNRGVVCRAWKRNVIKSLTVKPPDTTYFFL